MAICNYTLTLDYIFKLVISILRSQMIRVALAHKSMKPLNQIISSYFSIRKFGIKRIKLAFYHFIIRNHLSIPK